MSVRPVKESRSAPSRRSRAPASSCSARSASATPRSSIRFCCFDDFRNDNPEDYLAGFPWHPHRGIETITYVLAGTVEHGDSLGNRGSLGAGDVQWMTAGSGIMHQEMPKGDPHGTDARLPALGEPAGVAEDDGAALPGRRSRSDIPEVVDDDGTRVRVICGEFWGKKGPVEGVAADPRYLDVSVPPGAQQAPRRRNVAPCVRVRVRRLRHVPRRVRARSACRPKLTGGATRAASQRTG